MTLRDDHQATPGGGRCPGVYFEEVFPPPVTAFRSGVPVFVGFVEADSASVKASKCYALNRWDQFGMRCGRPVPDGFLAYGVRGFFENGGAHCFVLPIPLTEEGPGRLADELHKAFRPGSILDDLEDADLVCVPDVAMAALGQSDGPTPWELQRTVLEYCQRMKDRFAILDALPAVAEGIPRGQGGGRAAIETAVDQGCALCSDTGALYFPWVRVTVLNSRDGFPSSGKDPRKGAARGQAPSAGSGSSGILVPPSGHVAGIYARSDGRIGVHKAPANESLEGVIDLEIELAGEQQTYLNDAGINCIRSFPGRGMRVWGARTLSRQLAWRYVNVRRLFLSLTRWAELNLQEFVFEPNAAPLWERVRYRLASYCHGLFQQGALKGGDPAEAYYVKCDAETNPLEVREAGQLIAEVGLAAAAPAEFVIVRITQSSAGASVSTLVGP